jgi:primase-polymerase (primpol)-like protein
MVILQQPHSLTGDYLKHIRTTTQCGAGDPLEDLKARSQWVAWRWGKVRKDGKREKVPINPSTRCWAKSNNPSSWATFQQALALAQEPGYEGVMVAITEDDPYFMVDQDGCRDKSTGEVHPAAWKIVEELDTYTEVSPSGTGTRTIGVGTKPGSRCVSKNIPWSGQIEIYDQKRFCTITEEVLEGTGSFVRDSQDTLNSLYRTLWTEPQEPVQAPVRTGANHTRTLTDRELLDKARNAKQLGPKFIALYDRGDLSWSGGDASRADNDLMSQLAFLTGHDAVWMEALFSQSALGQRDKWTSRPDYRKRTIDHAIENTKKYEPEKFQPREGSTTTRDKLLRMAYHAALVYRWAEITGNHQRAARAARAYAAYKVFLREAWKANSLEIGMSEREMMVDGGYGGRVTAAKAIASLIDTHRVVVKIKDGGPGESARYRIKDIAHPILGQSKIEEQFFTNYPPCEYYEIGPGLGKSVEIRNTSPASYKDYDKNGRRIVQGIAAPVNSVGKVAAWVLDIIHYFSHITGEPATLELLFERTGVRRDHLKERHVRKLLEAGLILEDSDGYTTPENVPERLEWELEDSGCNKKKRQQEEKNAKEREIMHIHRMRKAGADFDRIARLTGRSVAFVMDVLKIPDVAPSYDDLDRLKERREIRDANGYIEELERASELWRDTFPEPESEQEPLGHEYAPTLPPEPSQEPRESRLSSSGEVPRGHVTKCVGLYGGERIRRSWEEGQDHPLECDCLECSIPALRYARTLVKDERHDYASLVT